MNLIVVRFISVPMACCTVIIN